MKNINYKSLFSVSAAMLAGGAAAFAQSSRPNILIILTDQHSGSVTGFMGDPDVQTPSMDYLANHGYAFAHGYSANPVSVPARLAIMTGTYPSTFKYRRNTELSQLHTVDIDGIERNYANSMGFLFANAGYDTYYGGKIHLPTRNGHNTTDIDLYGFEHTFCIDQPTDFSFIQHRQLGEETAELLRELAEKKRDKPFLMVSSFINPHDICDFQIVDKPESNPVVSRKITRMGVILNEMRKLYEIRQKDEDEYWNLLPPLPDNFEPTEGVKKNCVRGIKTPFTDERWRQHNYIYDRLVEDLDYEIAPIVEALQTTGLLKNTIVIFTSDHGEMNGAHRQEAKDVPYEECCVVPFVFLGPGVQSNIIDRSNAVSAGIDLLPTILDFAGIESPGLPGTSVKALLTGEKTNLNRPYVFCEGRNWFQVIKDGRYKYTIFEEKGNPDMLIDLVTDPGEMHNLSDSPEYKKLCNELNKVLKDSIRERGAVLRESANEAKRK